MEPHFPRNMDQKAVPVLQLDSEHGVGQELENRALYFNCVFPRHVRISGSPFVIRTVCSK
jgi:hypothetical protein